MQIILLPVLLCMLGLQVEGKKYGLPDPVRRYSLVDPIQRPPRTTITASSTLSTPNANAPIYASDFSSGGYFQPVTNPQYIRNATFLNCLLTCSTTGVQVRMHADFNL
jgi:hypothetical protein